MTVGGEPFSVDAGQNLGVIPVDVRVVADITETQPEAPEFGACLTFNIPQIGSLPEQILQRRIRRKKAYVEVNFSVAGNVYFANNQQVLTNPTVGGYLVSVPVAGLYRLPDWESQQPLYVIASVAGLTASVIDQAYGGTS